ncbi:hypothetical protein [Chryseobacterium sp. MYb328]|uniref:hypothetical protein n=1 Tax=Chryseobacterium sp. MYb328 TaxID=2745231 RepID=UPI0030A6E810
MATKKKGNIQVFAKNIRGTANGGILEESKYTRNISGGRHVQNGLAGGVNNDVNKERSLVEETRVKNIESLDKFEEGSANDGSGINKKEGILYGKTYRFKVKEYTNGEPRNPNSIRWAIEYIDPETGRKVENILTNKDYRGIELNVNFTSHECCGGNLEVRAYIENPEIEGKLPVFMHNRFRWFDRKILENQVEQRRDKPYLADQNDTPTCGMAAILYILAKKDFEKYKNFVLTLHRTGIGICNNYKVDVDESKHLLEMNPVTNTKYPSNPNKMPYADWIPFSCMRDKENEMKDFDGENDEVFDGSTLPRELSKLMSDVLNFTSVTDNTNVVFTKGALPWDGEDSSSREVAKMQELYLDGYTVCMLINANMLSNKKSGVFTPIEHWIVFEGVIGGTITPDVYDFEVFTWGEIRKVIINPSVFSTNFYGYVYGK